ncbi:MAG TPA: PEP-utilizing enzyme [Thermoanaerobaculia bacterium]|nr:PEP-utilizing enzyme [Thermoanaerobaculia bacterium]
MPEIDRPFLPPGPGSWELDATHMNRPLSRWFAEVFPPAFVGGFQYGTARYGVLLDHLEPGMVNRFIYHCPRPVGAPKGAKGPPPKLIFKILSKLHPEMRRRIKQSAITFERKLWREDLARWDNEVKPAIAKENSALQAIDPRSLSDAALIDHLEACRAAVERGVRYHHEFNITAMLPVGDLLVQAMAWTGLPAGQILELMRGASPVSLGAADELEAVVREIRPSNDLRRLLREADPARALETLTSRQDAVGEATRKYIAKVGIRVATGYDVADMTLGEMPDLIVKTIRAEVEREDAVATGDEAFQSALSRVRERVPEQHRVQFDQLLEEARFTYRIRDERGYLNDAWSTGIARRALLAAGERLRAKGKLLDASHAFELTPKEVGDLLAGRPGPTAEEVAEHAAYRAGHTTNDAPRFLGNPPQPPPPAEWLPPAAARMSRIVGIVLGEMFAVKETVKEGRVITGYGASPGQFAGTARLVLQPADMAKVRGGDILVTRSTAPSYNGLLPLLRGIVTDRGGTLSHAALVAREYGIPAVVGCGNATERIADGAQIRIDGATGSVEILS